MFSLFFYSVEKSICQAFASVMLYDDNLKKWMSSGVQGMSRVHIYQHTVNNSFRVVGRLTADQSVSMILVQMVFIWQNPLNGFVRCWIQAVHVHVHVVLFSAQLSHHSKTDGCPVLCGHSMCWHNVPKGISLKQMMQRLWIYLLWLMRYDILKY